VASGDVPASSGIRVALVQAGVDHVGIGSGDRRAVMRRLAELTTAELRSTDVELIIWPENAVDVDPYHDAEARATVAEASLAAGVPILFGALLESAEGRRNVSALQDGPHLNTVYVKQRLVPFGEVLPARDLLTRYTDRTRHLPIDFVPGAGPGAVSAGGLRLGIVICFEVADEGLVEAALRSGAVALIVQTNNATYAGLGQSEQQLRIAQYRAKSLRVPVFVISTNGPTAVIDVNGRIVRRIDEGGVGVLTADLPAARVRP
jgi:apolipoprotein N-acyltransferase